MVRYSSMVRRRRAERVINQLVVGFTYVTFGGVLCIALIVLPSAINLTAQLLAASILFCPSLSFASLFFLCVLATFYCGPVQTIDMLDKAILPTIGVAVFLYLASWSSYIVALTLFCFPVVIREALSSGILLFLGWTIAKNQSIPKFKRDALNGELLIRLPRYRFTRFPKQEICQNCKGLLRRSGLAFGSWTVFIYVEEWYSLHDISSSSCHVCRLLSFEFIQRKTSHRCSWVCFMTDPMAKKNMTKPKTKKNMTLGIRVLDARVSTPPIRGPIPHWLCISPQLYVIERRKTAPDGDDDTFYISTGAQRVAEIAKEWIKTCSQHSGCVERGTDMSFIPSRLIYIGSSVLQLMEKSDLCWSRQPTYTALSHCWGGNIQTKLTSATYESMKEGIGLGTLPATFRDAISFTRAIGVDYIWIDSLCIIQNSREDWAQESTLMKNVFANAMCAISATASNNAEGGCFRQLERPRGVFVVASGWRKDLAISGSEMPSDLLETLFEQMVEQAPVSKRAWIFQERMLSRRMIHFCDQGVLFECHTLRASEFNRTGVNYEKAPFVMVKGRRIELPLLNRIQELEGREDNRKETEELITEIAKSVALDVRADHTDIEWKVVREFTAEVDKHITPKVALDLTAEVNKILISNFPDSVLTESANSSSAASGEESTQQSVRDFAQQLATQLAELRPSESATEILRGCAKFIIRRAKKSVARKSAKEIIQQVVNGAIEDHTATRGLYGALDSLVSMNAQNKLSVWEEFVFNQRWYEIVSGYSRRRLTKQTDKLAALAGVAELIENSAKVSYAAGLWADVALEFGLLWRVMGPQKKPSDYRAPSWSWASVDGRIELLPYGDMPRQSASFFARVHAVNVTLNGKTISTAASHVDGGLLEIAGPAVNVSWKPQDPEFVVFKPVEGRKNSLSFYPDYTFPSSDTAQIELGFSDVRLIALLVGLFTSNKFENPTPVHSIGSRGIGSPSAAGGGGSYSHKGYGKYRVGNGPYDEYDWSNYDGGNAYTIRGQNQGRHSGGYQRQNRSQHEDTRASLDGDNAGHDSRMYGIVLASRPGQKSKIAYERVGAFMTSINAEDADQVGIGRLGFTRQEFCIV